MKEILCCFLRASAGLFANKYYSIQNSFQQLVSVVAVVSVRLSLGSIVRFGDEIESECQEEDNLNYQACV